jgi:hypothetical protein
MGMTVEQLAKAAMSLPSQSRAELADFIVESLEGDEIGQVQEVWIAEAKRRRDEVRAGKVATIPGEDALRAVRDSIK